MADTKIPIDTWRGVRVDKMKRQDLEAEFIRLATAEAQRLASPFVDAAKSPPKPPLDPHTARSLRELKSVAESIEAGAAGVLEFGDSIEAEPRLLRKMLIVIGYTPARKP